MLNERKDSDVLTWAQICRVAEMIGFKPDDGGKASAFKLREALLKTGKAKQVAKGLYQYVRTP